MLELTEEYTIPFYFLDDLPKQIFHCNKYGWITEKKRHEAEELFLTLCYNNEDDSHSYANIRILVEGQVIPAKIRMKLEVSFP